MLPPPRIDGAGKRSGAAFVVPGSGEIASQPSQERYGRNRFTAFNGRRFAARTGSAQLFRVFSTAWRKRRRAGTFFAVVGEA